MINTGFCCGLSLPLFVYIEQFLVWWLSYYCCQKYAIRILGLFLVDLKAIYRGLRYNPMFAHNFPACVSGYLSPWLYENLLVPPKVSIWLRPQGLVLVHVWAGTKKIHIEKKPSTNNFTGPKTLQKSCGSGLTHGLSSST